MIVKIAYNINREACSMSCLTYSTFYRQPLKHIFHLKRLRHLFFFFTAHQNYIYK
uniref:Uncharacterized protein n=1 Tax=Anguilla anguilla TaxID=7936 RepID=A0A0E9WRP8_ANGAN